MIDRVHLIAHVHVIARVHIIACAMTFASAHMAHAQSPAAERPVRRVEVAIGAGALGGSSLGSEDANLRANEATRRPFRLFSTDNRFARAPTAEVRAGFALNRRFAAEGLFVFSRPDVRTSISADVEGAPSLAVVERIDQYFVEGSLVIMIDPLRLGGRTVPFAAMGAGYLRQLHEGLTIVEEGHLYHLGGGFKHWLMARDRGRIRAAGLRADMRLYLMARGIAFDDRPRPHGAISGSVFVSF